MRRIGLAVGLAVGLVLAPLVAEAQKVEKTARVGVLSPGPGPVSSSRVLEAFRQRLRELGYIEGRNLAIEWRFAAGDPEHLPEFAAELVRLNVDVNHCDQHAGSSGGKAGHGENPNCLRSSGRCGGL